MGDLVHTPNRLFEPVHSYTEDLQQENIILLRISMREVDTSLRNILQHRRNLNDKSIVLEFFGSANWHNVVPNADQDLLRQLEEADHEDSLGLVSVPKLREDLEAGVPEALIAVILLIIIRYGNKLHLHLDASSFLHNFPILKDLFHEPKVSSRTGHKTWSRPSQWEKPYWTNLLESLAPRLQTLELSMTWSMASTVSYPPFKTMIPISRLPNFCNLQRLALPYFAVIPRPKTCVTVLPTSAFPASLAELVITEAYPSLFLLEWLREVQASKKRLKQLGAIEVRFNDSFARRSYDAFVGEANGNGGYLNYEPPILVISLTQKGDGGTARQQEMGDIQSQTRDQRGYVEMG